MHQTHSDSSGDQGSFLTGFTLGLFAGAAGYFLFATDKGKRVKNSLAKEWQAAQENLFEVGNSTPARSLRDMIRVMVAQILPDDQSSQASRSSAKAAAKPRKPVAAKEVKFKGT